MTRIPKEKSIVFQPCILCKQTFFVADLADERCLLCWKQIADRIAREKLVLEHESRVYGDGYITAHNLIVNSKCTDIEVLKNPFDVQAAPVLYAQWRAGATARLGDYVGFLREQGGNDVVMNGKDGMPGLALPELVETNALLEMARS